MNTIEDVIDQTRLPLDDVDFQISCKQKLDRDGVLVLNPFLRSAAIENIQREGVDNEHLAYFCQQNHNVYLTPADPDFDSDHPRNREIVSSKGCITDDQIPADSLLRTLYDSDSFRDFLKAVSGEENLYQYADPLSSINLHYARAGEELGWHFDNSSFAITLLIQKPDAGGDFEYVTRVRDADQGEMNFDGVAAILDGEVQVKQLSIEPGALVLFRGRNALHRVTPVVGDTTRMLVVLAYNAQPDVALSESARMTFYGRLK